MFGAFPLLALPVAIYNLIALTVAGGFGAVNANDRIIRPLFTLKTAAGGMWAVSPADLLLAASLVVMFIELIKSTANRRIAIVNHSLTMLLFVVCLVELLLAPAFATSTFFLITLMVFLDVLAGFIVTIVSARREVDVVNEH